ncbi:MAG: 1-acyl-sn-glycerol-3-phosphate acyltransferase [Bacteroidales bacterium]|nr:1-acyl-sn-glycerol-3-phosphate acyltransferase [Bacteroidales bacterium]
MISFENISRYDRGYHLLNFYLRFTHTKLYYKKVQIIGRENIPPRGTPTLVIGNHQNALMDALAILHLFDDHRQPVFIARGDIFKKSDTIAKILRFLKIMPTFRTRDGDRSDIRSNNVTFDLGARIIADGGTVAMFPEAAHQAGKFMSSFKKGYPRLAFRAAELSDYQTDVKILPLYIYYGNYFNFREQLLIVVGKPFHFDEFYDLYKTEPNNAFLALNDKSKTIIQNLGVDMQNSENYETYEPLCYILRQKVAKNEKRNIRQPFEQLQCDKEIVSRIEKVKNENEARYHQLMENTQEYLQLLKKLKIRDWLFTKKITGSTLLLQALLLIICFPIYLFGLINNILPFKACELLKRKMKDKMFRSTLNYTVSVLVAFPIAYIAIFVAAWCISKCVLIAIAYLLATFVTLFFFYEYKKRFIKFWGSCRFSRYKRAKNADFLRAFDLRNYITKTFFE